MLNGLIYLGSGKRVTSIFENDGWMKGNLTAFATRILNIKVHLVIDKVDWQLWKDSRKELYAEYSDYESLMETFDGDESSICPNDKFGIANRMQNGGDNTRKQTEDACEHIKEKWNTILKENK